MFTGTICPSSGLRLFQPVFNHACNLYISAVNGVVKIGGIEKDYAIVISWIRVLYPDDLDLVHIIALYLFKLLIEEEVSELQEYISIEVRNRMNAFTKPFPPPAGPMHLEEVVVRGYST